MSSDAHTHADGCNDIDGLDFLYFLKKLIDAQISSQEAAPPPGVGLGGQGIDGASGKDGFHEAGPGMGSKKSFFTRKKVGAIKSQGANKAISKQQTQPSMSRLEAAGSEVSEIRNDSAAGVMTEKPSTCSSMSIRDVLLYYLFNIRPHSDEPRTIQKLEEKVKALQTGLQETEQKLKKAQTENERLSNLLLEMNAQRLGHLSPDAESHKQLLTEYRHLFEKDAPKAADYLSSSHSAQEHMPLIQLQDGKASSREKEYICELFCDIYELCKSKILGEMFKDVFRPLSCATHTESTGLDSGEIKDRVGVYGMCVANTPVLQSGTQENNKLMWSVFTNLKQKQQQAAAAGHNVLVQQHFLATQQQSGASGTTDNPLDAFLKKAILIAWKMLTIQPPMIVTLPSEGQYDPEFHDYDVKNWSKKKAAESDMTLMFFRPAAYYTFEEEKPAIKAKVGNKTH